MYTLENKRKFSTMRISAHRPDRTRTSCVVAQPERIYLLADDLTGACDAAAAFLPAGYSVRVWTGGKAWTSTPETVQAFNTDSRSLSPSLAGRAVSDAVAALDTGKNFIFFKKIDSVARGPLAAELLAAQRTLGTQAILLAPSFPAAGRTVHHGILHIQDASGQDRQLSLAALFPAEFQPRIASISRPEELAAAFHSGKALLLCDAATQTELVALARAAVQLPGLLYAGSAGLAQAIASLHCSPEVLPPLPVSERTLIVAGSPHPLTRLQLENLSPDHLAADSPVVRILRIHCKASDDEHIRAAFCQFDPQALILTGGSTASMATSALGAHSLILRGEFAPGIPWGIVQGGAAEGRVAITKSGGFGAPTALREILDKLSGQL